MKVFALITIIVVIFAVSTTAQRRRCPQGVRTPNCTGARDVGTRCGTAPPRQLWYYNQASRTCIAMDHLGCGGNSNRWCTRRACEQRCRRRRTG